MGTQGHGSDIVESIVYDMIASFLPGAFLIVDFNVAVVADLNADMLREENSISMASECFGH